MIPGVILAAGDSTRMGFPKALLLTREGRPFVSSIVGAYAAAGLDEIVVVTGRDHDRIADVLSIEAFSVAPRIVRNPDPSRGQLSSLLTGMDAVLTPDTPALAVTLVDVPLLSAETVRLVIAEWQRTRAPIVRPAIGERHGHPWFSIVASSASCGRRRRTSARRRSSALMPMRSSTCRLRTKAA
jgi:molybdenum cofactor cytidylyltransferase